VRIKEATLVDGNRFAHGAAQTFRMLAYLLSALIGNVHSAALERPLRVDNEDSEQYLARVWNHSEHLRGKSLCPLLSPLAAEHKERRLRMPLYPALPPLAAKVT
jgi:hypothetical protein